jgi:putative protein-disulfide isomerase
MNTVVYCYDAYCGWCYGFSPVIRRLAEEFSNEVFFEVLSCGMILNKKPVSIAHSASYIRTAYKSVEEYTGIRFGQDYLWHIYHPDQSDWFPDSEKPAIALCIFKELQPNLQVPFASDLQYALHYEGRDLCDDEAYRLLLQKYHIPAQSFFEKLHSETYKKMAYEEFDVLKKLGISGYPTVLLQESEFRFHLLARGYTPYEDLKARLATVMENLNSSSHHK